MATEGDFKELDFSNNIFASHCASLGKSLGE
jgi:hypothetical protein